MRHRQDRTRHPGVESEALHAPRTSFGNHSAKGVLVRSSGGEGVAAQFRSGRLGRPS